VAGAGGSKIRRFIQVTEQRYEMSPGFPGIGEQLGKFNSISRL
jgi:hypothetical protein